MYTCFVSIFISPFLLFLLLLFLLLLLFFFFFTSVLMCTAFQPIIASSCHKMTSDSLSSTLLLSALLLTTKLLTHATPMVSHNDTGSFLNDVLRQVSQVQLEVNILKGTRASIKSKQIETPCFQMFETSNNQKMLLIASIFQNSWRGDAQIRLKRNTFLYHLSKIARSTTDIFFSYSQGCKSQPAESNCVFSYFSQGLC